jgi:hypothetical protein
VRQHLSLEVAEATGLGQSEHLSLVSIIKNKTAKD